MAYDFLCRLGKVGRAVYHRLQRRKLRNPGVTLISNNCWGGFMYQYYGLPFNSPFIGLFMFAEDYIRVLEDPSLLQKEMTFISRESSRYASLLNSDYPIGLIDGEIEIHFLHFKSPEEALTKWRKRLSRIDWNNAIVKFSETQECTPDLIERFDHLPYREKICFTLLDYPHLASTLRLKMPKGAREVKSCWKMCEPQWNFVERANSLLK